MPERDQRGEVEHEKELPVVTDRKQRLVEVRGEKLAAAEGDEKGDVHPDQVARREHEATHEVAIALDGGR